MRGEAACVFIIKLFLNLFLTSLVLVGACQQVKLLDLADCWIQLWQILSEANPNINWWFHLEKGGRFFSTKLPNPVARAFVFCLRSFPSSPSSINQISKGPVETLCSFRKDPSVIKDEICEYDWYHICDWLDPFHDLLSQLSQVVPGTPHRPALKDRFHQIQDCD